MWQAQRGTERGPGWFGPGGEDEVYDKEPMSLRERADRSGWVATRCDELGGDAMPGKLTVQLSR